jgi:antitoxin VapB
MSAKAKLFTNGKNQAVRIPKAMEFKGIDEVKVRQEGDELILSPVRKNWLSFASLPHADKDFMQERPTLLDSDRVSM